MSVQGLTVGIGNAQKASKRATHKSGSLLPLSVRYLKPHASMGEVDSDDCCGVGEDEYAKKIRERFDRDFLPKYGLLWQRIIEARDAQLQPSLGQQCNINNSVEHKTVAHGQLIPLPADAANGVQTASNFLDAIERRRPVTMILRKRNEYCNCGCVTPFEEFVNDNHLNDGWSNDQNSLLVCQTRNVAVQGPSDLVSSKDNSAGDHGSIDESQEVGGSMQQGRSIDYPSYAKDGAKNANVSDTSRSTISSSYNCGHPEDAEQSNPISNVDSQKEGTDGNTILSDLAEETSDEDRSNWGGEDYKDDEWDEDESYSSGNTSIRIDLLGLGPSSPKNDSNQPNDRDEDDAFFTVISSSSRSPQGAIVNGAAHKASTDELGSRPHILELHDVSKIGVDVQNDTRSKEQSKCPYQGFYPPYDFDSRQHSVVGTGQLVQNTQTIDLVESSAEDSSVEIIKEIQKPVAKRNFKKVHGGARQTTSKSTFLRSRDGLTMKSFEEFNLRVFGGNLQAVEVEWSKKLNTTAGLTRLRKFYDKTTRAVKRQALIVLSTKVIDDEEKLRTTLLHEMIHAAVWLLEGVTKPPHGAEFKRWATKAMKAIPGARVTTTHSYEIQYKYAWACKRSGCNFVVKRHSKSVDPNRHGCGRCKGQLVEIQVDSGSIKTPKEPPRPSEYNRFVKEQSKTIRRTLVEAQMAKGIATPSVTQPNVMKECARLWRELKNSK